MPFEKYLSLLLYARDDCKVTTKQWVQFSLLNYDIILKFWTSYFCNCDYYFFFRTCSMLNGCCLLYSGMIWWCNYFIMLLCLG